MMAAVILGWGLASGADWRLIALAGGAIWLPFPTGVAVVAAILAGARAVRRSKFGLESRFVEAVLGELRAGSSLRWALRAALVDLGGSEGAIRRLDVGDPLADCVDEELGDRLPGIGPLVASAVAEASLGGRMVPVFELLLAHAKAEEAALVELRTSTAQVRASMGVLVGGPLAYLTFMIATGRLGRLLALPGSRIVSAVGLGLFLVGSGAMVGMARWGS
ncbi:MAG: hypothetical protein WB239_16120 [Acidimicrobiia bacterium]